METLAKILGLASGFALMGHQASALNVLATSIVVNLSLAPLTCLIARRRGRSAALWAVLGLCLGMWALAAAMLLRTPARQSEPPSQLPPSSHAA